MSYSYKITKTIPEFQYFSPETMPEAISMMTRFNGRAKVLAGGTDLLVMMKQRAVQPECVINIKNIPELSYIREDEEGIKIGPLTKITAIEKSGLIKEKCSCLYEATRKFATVLVKNMATIGGNICRSSPSADMVPPLLVFDAVLKVVGPGGEREILLENFFTGPGTNVLEQEILREIVIPKKDNKYGTAFAKVMRNSADLAKINCAVRIVVVEGNCEEIRIALGAVGPRPIRAKKVEEAIYGKKINDEVIAMAAHEVVEDIAPITDVRSTAEYRTEVSEILVRRLIKLSTERS